MGHVRYAARPLEAIRTRELAAPDRAVWSDSLEAVYAPIRRLWQQSYHRR